MLIIRHLGKSQSERIAWLCEELKILYELKLYRRDPITMLAPPEYTTLAPLGAAPVIVIAHPTRMIGCTGSLAASTKRTVSRTEAPLAFAVMTTERKAA